MWTRVWVISTKKSALILHSLCRVWPRMRAERLILVVLHPKKVKQKRFVVTYTDTEKLPAYRKVNSPTVCLLGCVCVCVWGRWGCTDVVLEELLPLSSAAVVLEVLGEGGAAVGGGEVGEQILKGGAFRMLVQKRSDDGHQRAQQNLGAWVWTRVCWPKWCAKTTQQKTHLLPGQT